MIISPAAIRSSRTISQLGAAIIGQCELAIAPGTPFRARLAARSALDNPSLPESDRPAVHKLADPVAPDGFCILHDRAFGPTPCPVRLTTNLVDAGNVATGMPAGMMVFGAAGHENDWPLIYADRESAQSAIDAAVSECAHEWRVVSHEEDACTRCGIHRFTPDL